MESVPCDHRHFVSNLCGFEFSMNMKYMSGFAYAMDVGIVTECFVSNDAECFVFDEVNV